jgi:aminoglycoside phosphotransferase (APT) family kinase protein
MALFCKYESPRANSHGHRSGVRYEGAVYRTVLSAGGTPTPRFIGTYEAPHEAWLVLESLDHSERLSDLPHAMSSAAQWLGAFHAELEGAIADPKMSFLVRYDAEYYRGWAQRTLTFAREHGRDSRRLSALCATYSDGVSVLAEFPRTVVHGEFTIHNVLVRDGLVFPTDWESAAIGPGEIDLMCLLDRWPSEVVEQCTRAYMDARYGGEAPSDLAIRLAWSELYLHLRWLGEHPDLMLHRKRVWRLERLEEIAAEWGIDG